MILIAAGHNPYARGVVYNNVAEYDVAKVWAAHIASLLGGEGMAMPSGTLKEKREFMLTVNSVAIAVEVHFNFKRGADEQPTGEGSETLYSVNGAESRRAAYCVQENLGRVFPPDLGAREGWFSVDDRTRGIDYFLSRLTCPAIIIAPEYLHNTDRIITRMQEGCSAIAEGLLTWSKSSGDTG